MQPLTTDQLRAALPDKVKKSVSTDMLARINKTLSEPELYEQYRDNLVGYAHILQDGRFKLENYISAVKYVSHKLMGCTNQDAYSKTFPEKIQRFTQQGVAAKDIASYIHSYNKTKLVNLIFEQSMTPSWVLNQDLYQKALNVQADLMLTANSEKVRSDAANSLLTHLKMPETHKVELDIGVKKDSSIDALRQATQALVYQQRERLIGGDMSAGEVAKSQITYDNDTGDTVKESRSGVFE